MESKFNINELKTNENINIIFTPGTNVKEYEIIIYKDEEEYKKENIISNKEKNILITETGKYQIKVNLINGEEKQTVTSGIYVIDKQAPTIEFTKKVITIKQGKSFDPNEYIIVKDNFDENLSIKTNYNKIDFNQIGAQTITYEVSDTSGNISTKTIIVNIKKNNDNILMIYQGFIGFFILALVFLIIWFQKKQKKFNRTAKYSVQGIKENNKSLMDYFVSIYMSILKFVVNILKNSAVFKKQGEKYTKYVSLSNLNIKNGLTLIAHKIIFGLVFLIICSFSKAILKDIITFPEAIVIYIIGYYLLDIKYIILYKKYHKRLEEDLLESVVIMNNAFKVGASPEQAIKIVSEEMTGTMQQEYKQIYAEIKFGLSINDAFTRFSERLNLKEAEYIAASLNILNETGGDVVKIFDSIEKNLFNTRKIKNEYEALTGSPKLISNFLFILPVIFILLILMINIEYFNPLFQSKTGLFLIFLAGILYIVYIIIIKRIFKIRM